MLYFSIIFLHMTHGREFPSTPSPRSLQIMSDPCLRWSHAENWCDLTPAL